MQQMPDIDRNKYLMYDSTIQYYYIHDHNDHDRLIPAESVESYQQIKIQIQIQIQ